MRSILIVLDGVGCGSLPDAAFFGDEGANTIAHVAKAVGGLSLPHLQEWGLGHITPILGVAPVDKPLALYGKMAEKSPGKDTITGHWELAGMRLHQPFAVYPEGFPVELIHMLETGFDTKILANCAASGTEIIERFGQEHQATGFPIVYTSADSVLQIAAHMDTVPLETLYKWCEIARKVCRGKYEIARIIARPFMGVAGAYQRTADRHDYPLSPIGTHLLTHFQEQSIPVFSVGKIEDIYVNEGIYRGYKTKGNADGLERTMQILRNESQECFLFVNLVEFDSLWGHRNNPAGFAKALQDFDETLPLLQNLLREDDMLIITADHGTDPTWPGTDHTREYVPLLIYRPSQIGGALGTRSSFSDVAATLAHRHGVKIPYHGERIKLS